MIYVEFKKHLIFRRELALKLSSKGHFRLFHQILLKHLWLCGSIAAHLYPRPKTVVEITVIRNFFVYKHVWYIYNDIKVYLRSDFYQKLYKKIPVFLEKKGDKDNSKTITCKKKKKRFWQRAIINCLFLTLLSPKCFVSPQNSKRISEGINNIDSFLCRQ